MTTMDLNFLKELQHKVDQLNKSTKSLKYKIYDIWDMSKNRYDYVISFICDEKFMALPKARKEKSLAKALKNVDSLNSYIKQNGYAPLSK